jgi:hypothetical protein
MKALLRTAAVAVLLAPAACTDPAPPPQPAWPPPLRLPVVAAGAACPVDCYAVQVDGTTFSTTIVFRAS